MAWALQGAVRVLQQGKYTEVPSSRRALEAWRLRADVVKEFVTYRCEVPADRKDYSEPTLLYQAFKRHCEETGHKFGAGMALTKFVQRLKQIGCEQTQVAKKRCYPPRPKKDAGTSGNAWARNR
jgi:phage/plasmid-associated DNA primase